MKFLKNNLVAIGFIVLIAITLYFYSFYHKDFNFPDSFRETGKIMSISVEQPFKDKDGFKRSNAELGDERQAEILELLSSYTYVGVSKENEPLYSGFSNLSDEESEMMIYFYLDDSNMAEELPEYILISDEADHLIISVDDKSKSYFPEGISAKDMYKKIADILEK
ncbi:MAG: hypothetical protein VB119_01400 [Candidatus Metalachnospira sp.]|nr:hypothetical protein [Candidatus Metalachnospira sp.]